MPGYPIYYMIRKICIKNWREMFEFMAGLGFMEQSAKTKGGHVAAMQVGIRLNRHSKLTQERNRTFYFSRKGNGIIDRLPVDIHETRVLKQPVIMDCRYFYPVLAKIGEQPIYLVLEKCRFPQTECAPRTVQGLEREQLISNQRRRGTPSQY